MLMLLYERGICNTVEKCSCPQLNPPLAGERTAFVHFGSGLVTGHKSAVCSLDLVLESRNLCQHPVRATHCDLLESASITHRL